MAGGPLLTVDDYGERCREILPRALFDILFGTYGDPHFESLTNNLEGFRRLKLRPRVLAGVGQRSLETTVLGQRIAFPVMLAPAGSLQRCHPEGELAAARAAGRVGTLMALSTASSFTIEEVARTASGPLWFQLYFFKDRELNTILVRRAEAAGYQAILLTVDNVTERTWEREYRHDVAMADHTAVLKPPAERNRRTRRCGQLWTNVFSSTDAPLLSLETWGAPISRPARDPANSAFVYQRCQRGIMHYDATTDATRAVLLADYLKGILVGRDLPADLAVAARGSPLFQQYCPGAPGWLCRPDDLPGTDLTMAFEAG